MDYYNKISVIIMMKKEAIRNISIHSIKKIRISHILDDENILKEEKKE